MSIHDTEYAQMYEKLPKNKVDIPYFKKKKITPILENQFYREVESDNRVKVFCKAFGISAFGFGLIGLIIYYNKWAFR
jgi:hypothetical protein